MNPAADSCEPARIFTIGHSTHPMERFLGLLRSSGIATIADVRRYPGSRRNPQFGAAALAASLAEASIGYESFAEELGGRRRATKREAELAASTGRTPTTPPGAIRRSALTPII